MIAFRLPARVRDALTDAARTDSRSLSSMTLLIVERWLVAEGYLRQQGKKPRQQRGRS